MAADFDTHFNVGTQSGRPNGWMAVGLWYPPRLLANPERAVPGEHRVRWPKPQMVRVGAF